MFQFEMFDFDVQLIPLRLIFFHVFYTWIMIKLQSNITTSDILSSKANI